MARKTKEEAQVTRAAILDAAEILFQERGVSHTSLAEIATAAGVTRGAVYWHFSNKVDLFDAMIQRVFGLFEAKLADLRAENDANPIELVRKLSLHFFDRVINDPRYFRIIEIAWHKCEYVGEMATIRDAHLECGNRYLAISEDCFRLAQERGFLSSCHDPRCAAIGLMAVTDGLVLKWTINRTSFPLKQYGPVIVDAYLHGLYTSHETTTGEPHGGIP